MSADFPVRRYRSVFVSDIHLGTRGCQAELLLDFIRHMECDRLYLVGDLRWRTLWTRTTRQKPARGRRK